jgi:hypothetical protein
MMDTDGALGDTLPFGALPLPSETEPLGAPLPPVPESAREYVTVVKPSAKIRKNMAANRLLLMDFPLYEYILLII